jgi:hypothetical protein
MSHAIFGSGSVWAEQSDDHKHLDRSKPVGDCEFFRPVIAFSLPLLRNFLSAHLVKFHTN